MMYGDRKNCHLSVNPQLPHVSIIEEELVKGVFTNKSRSFYLEIIDNLISVGAEEVILGCTEIPLLIKQNDVRVPIFDTATIHSAATLDFILKKTAF